MIKAAIFDMDGLLIDSDPLWLEAEAAALKKCNIDLTRERYQPTMGLRIDEVVEYWVHKAPWGDSPSKEEVNDDIWRNIIALTREKGVAKEGVGEVLKFLKKKNIKLALASSSLMKFIDVVVDRLEIRDYFELIYSAEHEKYGKPHPGVYITTADKLGVAPIQCIAFEDSFNGMLSAKSAKMKCVAVPEPGIKESEKLSITDVVLNSLRDFDEQVWNELSK